MVCQKRQFRLLSTLTTRANDGERKAPGIPQFCMCASPTNANMPTLPHHHTHLVNIPVPTHGPTDDSKGSMCSTSSGHVSDQKQEIVNETWVHLLSVALHPVSGLAMSSPVLQEFSKVCGGSIAVIHVFKESLHRGCGLKVNRNHHETRPAKYGFRTNR